MKPLPLNYQNFSEIIREGYVYADKTPFIAKMLSEGKNYFLSRPRRFGKSFFLSAINSLFSGDEELFKDLWIGQNKAFDFSNKFSEISLDMAVNSSSPRSLEEGIKEQLRCYAKAEDINIEAYNLGSMLSILIKTLKLKYDRKVVLLVDEYDSPVSDHIDNIKLAEANSEAMKYFYRKLKSLDAELRFVSVTGVTRFAFMGISAGLNN
jgi:hypothetical protein